MLELEDQLKLINEIYRNCDNKEAMKELEKFFIRASQYYSSLIPNPLPIPTIEETKEELKEKDFNILLKLNNIAMGEILELKAKVSEMEILKHEMNSMMMIIRSMGQQMLNLEKQINPPNIPTKETDGWTHKNGLENHLLDEQTLVDHQLEEIPDKLMSDLMKANAIEEPEKYPLKNPLGKYAHRTQQELEDMSWPKRISYVLQTLEKPSTSKEIITTLINLLPEYLHGPITSNVYTGLSEGVKKGPFFKEMGNEFKYLYGLKEWILKPKTETL